MSRHEKHLRPRDKKRRVKTIVQHSRAQDTGELVERMKTFGETWAAKLEQIARRLDEFVVKSAAEVGSLWAAVQQLAKSAIAHDTSILAQDKINREVFGQLQQIDRLLNQLTTQEQRDQWLVPDEIREGAKKWYHDIVAAAFQEVAKEREAKRVADEAAAKQRAEEEAAKKAADEAAAAEQRGKEEAKTVETELRQAELPSVAPAGGEGQAAYPPGAEFFGGPAPQQGG